MNISVTGTSDVDDWSLQQLLEASARIRTVIHALDAPTAFFTGAAFGVDTWAAQIAFAAFPDVRHVLVIPAAPHNYDLVCGWEGETMLAKRGRTDARSYMLRNDLLIAQLEPGTRDRLLAFPAGRAEVQRSGTWSTVRRARKARVAYQVTALLDR